MKDRISMGSVSGVPLVSIIVPVYNGEQYLRESLDSIIAQTYPRTEVLVMDDASTDGTPDIIKSYDNKVTYYRQLKNRGQFENVNDGITKAKGDYTAVYHADDVYHPNIVEQEVKFLQRYSEVGAVFCLAIFINAQGKEIGRHEIPSEVRGGHPLTYSDVFNALLKHKNHLLCGPSSMVRASVYQDVGPYRGEEFRIAADLEMWVRINREYPIGIIEDYLLSYRFGHSNLSRQYFHLRTEPERYFKIMDHYLEDGGRIIAKPDALIAYEAYRTEDRLMLGVNHYILGLCKEMKAVLDQVKVSQILGSSRIQRFRLLVLYLLLQGLMRIPRISFVADLFYQRWGIKRYQPHGSLIHRFKIYEFQKYLMLFKIK